MKTGDCEGNKDNLEIGNWAIENDTLIIRIFEEEQKWILVNGCLYNVTTSTPNLIGCRPKKLRLKKQTTNEH
jgi:hypothetical protein